MESLPEECLSNIISLTTPADTCRLSLVSTAFLSAADSDLVWNQFLPSDYQHFISRSDASPSSLAFSSKKNLYLHLSDSHLLIDGGKKSFSLDKFSGKKCFMIAAKDLAIACIGDLRLWKWISLPQSRFGEVAMLLRVYRFDIRAKISIHMLSPRTKYAAYFVFKLSTNPEAYGFRRVPVQTSVCIYGEVDDSTSIRIIDLDPNGPNVYYCDYDGLSEEFPENPPVCGQVDDQCPKQRKDGWMEIELGEYFNEAGGQEGDELEMTVKEIKDGRVKSGIYVHGVEIRPKNT